MEIIESKDFVTKIKEEICRLHPIQNPRENEDGSPYTEMEVVLRLAFDKDKKTTTCIYFLDGNDHGKSGTSTSYKLTEFVSFDCVKELIDFLLSEYPWMVNIYFEHQNFLIKFGYPAERELEEGITCSRIILEFNTKDKALMPVISEYLNYIVSTYYGLVSKTPTFQKRYEEYLDSNKRKIINAMSDEEIASFLEKLSPQDIKDMLVKMDNQYFFKIYNSIKGEEVPYEQKKLMRTDGE